MKNKIPECEIINKYNRAKSYARRYFTRQEDIEDFPQWVALQLSKERDTKLGFFVVDYLREKYGKSSSTTNDIRKQLLNTCELIEQSQSNSSILNEISCTRIKEKSDKYRNCVKDLSGKRKKIAEMYYYKNKTLKEIGKELGFSESRASQILKEVKEKIIIKMMLENTEDIKPININWMAI